MTAFKGLGTTGDSVGIVTPLDHKLAQSGMVVKTATPLQVRSGLFYNGTSTIVSGTAGMAYSVAAYTCATQRSAGSGVVFGGNDGALSVATTAAPGSNSRIDVIYHWHREFALDGVNSNPVIGVVQGTAAAVPTVPSLAAFPGAIELARVTVTAGATATNGAGVTITQTAPFTALSGGVVPFRNTTERDAGSFVEGQQGWMIDSKRAVVFNGTTWGPAGGSPLVVPTGISAGGSISIDGVVTSTPQSSVSIDGAFPVGFTVFRVTYDAVLSAATGLNAVLRTAGGVDSVTGYDNQRSTEVNTTSAALQSLNNAEMFLCLVSDGAGSRMSGTLTLMGPNAAEATIGWANAYAAKNPATAASGTSKTGIQHRPATAYTGITIKPGSGTVTIKSLRIEGVA